MPKSSHFSGQPLYGQVIKLLVLSAKPYKSESNFLNGRSWAYFLYLRQAPSVVFRYFGRGFRCFGEHDFQVCIGLIEELFEIQVIHQHNSDDCSKP